MAVEMGLFRMGECARERAWTPGAKNPFSPAAPEPFPTVPPQRDSAGGQLEAARGVLPVSDRAAGPGWWRPLPHEGELGADCAQDKPLWQLGRAAQVESISGLANKPLVRKNAGRHWFPLGRTLATGTRASWWRWLPSRGMQTAGDASATARPPGRTTWSKNLEDCCGERPRWEIMGGQLHALRPSWLTCGNVCASPQGPSPRRSSTEVGTETIRRASVRALQQAMAGKSLAQKWAAAAAEQAAKAAELDMPGMQEARAGIGEDALKKSAANKVRAEERARKKEAVLLREAQEARKMQLDLERLELDDQWGPQARAWSTDEAMLNKIIACAKFAAAMKIDRSAAAGIIHMVTTALVAGNVQRIQSVQNMETAGKNAMLILESHSAQILPETLVQTLMSKYTGTVLGERRIRKLGMDGRFAAPEMPMMGSPPKPMLQSRFPITYLIHLNQWNPQMIVDICEGTGLKIGENTYDAHMMPAQEHAFTPVRLTRESRRIMHGFILQSMAMRLTPMQVEALLLHVIKESMGAEGRYILDIFIDREGTAIKNKDTGAVVKVLPVKNPLAMRPVKDNRYAIAIPAALAAPQEITGAPAIWLMTASGVTLGNSGDQTRAYIINMGMGPAEFTFQWGHAREGPFGLQDTAAWVERKSQEAVNAAQEWLTNMITQAKTNESLPDPEALTKFLDPMGQIFYARSIRFAHPEIQREVREVVKQWQSMQAELSGKAKNGNNAREAWKKLGEMFESTLVAVRSVNQNMLDIHFSVHENTTWRALFKIAKGLHNPELRVLTQAAHSLVMELHIPLAAYSLVLESEHGQPGWVQGLSGSAGGPFMIGKIWETEIENARKMYQSKEASPNHLLIKLEREHGMAMLKATIKQEARVDVEPDAKQAFKQYLLEAILCEGGAIFVPKYTVGNMVNKLTGRVSECQGEPQGKFDIRHPEFPGLQLLPSDRVDIILMPILLEMVRSELLAPAATSERDQAELVAYLSRPFAKKLDVEAQAGKFTWADIEYGTDITPMVTEALQVSFVHELLIEARKGVWVHRDMVVIQHAKDTDSTALPQQLEQSERGLTRVMSAHPFQGGMVAARIIAALIAAQQVTVVGVSGAGLLISLPEMQDIIEILRADDDAVAQIGKEIKYDSIEPPTELVQMVGRNILHSMHTQWWNYMWLLATPDTTKGRLTLDDCPIKSQTSTLETFLPLAPDILPGSIWNCNGPVLNKAIRWLAECKFITIIEVRASPHGRRGMVILSTSLLSNMTDDDIEDNLGEVDALEVDEENRGVRLGDNSKMKNMLTKIKLKILAEEIDIALKEPTVVQGVQLASNGTVTALEGNADIETRLNLANKLGYQPTLELLLNCLVARLKSAKFKKTHKVWNCVGGILIMPAALIPDVSEDLASRFALWNPSTTQLEAITEAPAEAMEEDNPAKEDAFSAQIRKEVAKLGEESSHLLLPIRVDSSSSFGRFQAPNIYTDNDEEWAVGLDYTQPYGALWLQITLDREMMVTVIGILPRQSESTKIFTSMTVRTMDNNMACNQIQIQEGRQMHVALLPQPLIGQTIRVEFNKLGITGTGDPPGLRRLALFGRQPAAEVTSQEPRPGQEPLTVNAWSQMPGADKRGAGMISWAEGDGCGSSGSITHQITSLTIIAAKATSCVSTGYQSQNVLNNDASEWAVQVNNDKGLHKITLQLDQRAIVAGIAIHQGTRGRTFTRMHVCASGDHSTANEVILPPGTSSLRTWLAEPITCDSIDLCFSQEHVHGTRGAAGLRHVELGGYLLEPEDGDKGRAAKRR